MAEALVPTRSRTRRVQPVDELIGKRIRDLRLLRGHSQTDLAKALGMTFQQVQKYEAGVNRVSASTLIAISQMLRVSSALILDVGGTVDASSSDVRHRVPGADQIALLEAYEGLGDPVLQQQLLAVIKTLVRLRGGGASPAG